MYLLDLMLVGLFLLFDFSVLLYHGLRTLQDDIDYTQLIKENDLSTGESNENEPVEDDPAVIRSPLNHKHYTKSAIN